MVVNGDIYTSPVIFALQKLMNEIEDADNDGEKFLYEMLRRSKVMWESITINGLEIIGMTYNQFCEQCKEKRNIVFLTDEEVRLLSVNLKKAKQIEEILNS